MIRSNVMDGVIRKSQLLLIGINCFISLTLNAQTVDMAYIHSSIEARYNLEFDTVQFCETYIINGVPFDFGSFASELKKYKKSEIKFTSIANMTNTTWHHGNCDFMVIVGAGHYEQTKKSKLKELNSIRKNLNRHIPEMEISDYKCEHCKQVVVNGNPIGMYEAHTLVNELKPKNIEFINSYESANPAIFGENSENGLTEIFLKKR